MASHRGCLSKEVREALAEAGATLLRDAGKHYVYGLPNKRVVTLSRTPSDRRAEANQISDIRRTARMEPR